MIEIASPLEGQAALAMTAARLWRGLFMVCICVVCFVSGPAVASQLLPVCIGIVRGRIVVLD